MLPGRAPDASYDECRPPPRPRDGIDAPDPDGFRKRDGRQALVERRGVLAVLEDVPQAMALEVAEEGPGPRRVPADEAAESASS